MSSLLSFKKDFDEIYTEYFARMYRFAKEYVGDEDEAKSIVQDIFLSIWERRNHIKVQSTLSTYLFTLVKNRCIDYLRHKVAVKKHEKELALNLAALEQMEMFFSREEDIEIAVSKAIGTLPDKCREIFLLSRTQNKKYSEIAQILDISVNTVENQISIALKKLRAILTDF